MIEGFLPKCIFTSHLTVHVYTHKLVTKYFLMLMIQPGEFHANFSCEALQLSVTECCQMGKWNWFLERRTLKIAPHTPQSSKSADLFIEESWKCEVWKMWGVLKYNKSSPAPGSVDLPPSHCSAAPEIYLEIHSTDLLPETSDWGHYSL